MMSDETHEDNRPEEAESLLQKQPHKVVLLERPGADQKIQSPLIWFLFLLIPVAIAFYLSITRGYKEIPVLDRPEAADVQPVQAESGRGRR